MGKLNWGFKVNFVGDEHILLAFKKQDSEEWAELLLTIREYTELMSLLQGFNLQFGKQIEDKLVQHYLNG